MRERMSEITEPIWIIFRVIPSVVIIGALIGIFFIVQSSLKVDDVERYYLDVYENVISSQAAASRGVFDVNELDIITKSRTPYVRGSRFGYNMQIAQKCSPDVCKEYCSALYDLKEFPDLAECGSWLYENVCKCHKDEWGMLPDGSDVVWKGFWETSGFLGGKSASGEFPVSIKGSQSVVPATLRLVVFDTGG